MNFHVEKLKNGIIHLNFKDQKTLCKYMVRIEEYYESPVFANKVFELAEYIKWYQHEYGKWSYDSDWSGFNIPGHKVMEFKNKFKLRGCEKEIFNAIPDGDKFYLVATYGKGNDDIINHETAHAMFYLNNEYKNHMTALVEKHKTEVRSLSEWILKHYNESVLVDEIQAYLSTANMDYFNKKKIIMSQNLIDIFAFNHNLYR